MSSTNKTSHYNLPQFIGSDIPTWLGDFNSAMTAIDSGINAAATSASEAATTAAQALNRCPFPVGYGGFFQTNPNSIYAGTNWEQKKDVFILAAGDTYPAGSTGGEAQHTLTKAELPNGVVLNRNPTKKITIEGVKRNSITIDTDEWAFAANVDFSTAEGITLFNEPHNNMPPYFAMPFWVRTA